MDISKLPAQQQSHVRHTYPLQHKVHDSNRKKNPTPFSLFSENLIHKGKKQHDCPPCRSKHISSFSVFKDIHVKQFLQLYRQAGTIPSCNSKKHFSFRLFKTYTWVTQYKNFKKVLILFLSTENNLCADH